MQKYELKYFNKPMLVEEFDSLQDIYDWSIYERGEVETSKGIYTKDNLGREVFISNKNEKSSRKNDSWSGDSTWEETIKHIREGYYQNLEEIKNSIKNDNFKMDLDNLFKFSESVCGCDVNIEKYLAGEPEDMFEFEEQKINKFVNLFIAVGANCDITAEELRQRGIKIMSIIDKLESKKIRCNLNLFSFSQSGNSIGYKLTIIKAKKYKERLDMERLNYALTNPSFFRRIIFANNERHTNEEINKYGYYSYDGYGRSIEFKNDNTYLTEDIKRDNYIIFSTDKDFTKEKIDEGYERILNEDKE